MRILVATDGSEPAAVGLQLAAGITWPAGSAIRVVTAIDLGTALFGGPWPAAAALQVTDIEGELRKQARETVDQAAKPLSAAGLTAEAVVAEGRPATAIVEEAVRFAADLIILGARGHGAIEEMILGSVSAEVVDTSPIPTLIARGRGLGRVLFAWDGSPSAERAAALLETWPIFDGATIRVVAVTEPYVPWWTAGSEVTSPQVMELYLDAYDEIRAERRTVAEAMAARLAKAGRNADAETREGRAAEEILAAGTAWGAELIVMGSHGRTGLTRIALGSVARNVVHHARASVLVARGPVAGGDDDSRP